MWHLQAAVEQPPSAITPLNSSANSINASATATQVQKVYGINFLGTAATATSGNTIANLQFRHRSKYYFCKWNYVYERCNKHDIDAITNNTIHDLTSSNASVGTGNSSFVIGISIIDGNLSRQKNISGNTIYNLSNTLYFICRKHHGHISKRRIPEAQGCGNFAYNLFVTGASPTSAKIYGIYPAQGLVTCYNNIVSLG